jgi:acetyl-CoA C-acetyltransferase
MTAFDRTPILVGVGEASERIEAADYSAASPVELAARAGRAACEDAKAGGGLAAHIDLVAAIRQFEISTPVAVAPFGCADNMPRAVAERIGANPAQAILEVTGGQGPQHLVHELCHAIVAGQTDMALIFGSEAISTVRHLQSLGETRDWSQTVGGQMEDRGYGLEGLLTGELIQHGVRAPIQAYALFENARRARRGLGREAYGLEMGALFAPFTKVAHNNPHAMSQEVFSAEEIATVTQRNRLICDPFPRRVVSRDQANQGAAVLLTSVGKARELGIAQDRWVYLHGGGDVKERIIMERQDLSASPASVLAVKQALDLAKVNIDQVDVFDLYSCFPVAVFNICDAFGLSAEDPRGLTLTGGLPFFGGAGNNYSMHAIASMVRALRARPGAFGLVGANGGFLSKYSAGVYSTKPAAWTDFDSKAIQAEIKAWAAPPIVEIATGLAKIETYTIDYSGQAPRAIFIARTPDGQRLPALSDDQDLVQSLIATDPAGGQISLATDDKGRNRAVEFNAA